MLVGERRNPATHSPAGLSRDAETVTSLRREGHVQGHPEVGDIPLIRLVFQRQSE